MTTRDTWFGEIRALAACARFDADSWQRYLLPLADQAAILASDPEELRDVFLPTLAALAERWEDDDRINRRHEPRSDTLRLTEYVLDNALWIEALLTQDLTDVHTLDLSACYSADLHILLRLLESPQLQNLRTLIPSIYLYHISEDSSDPIARRVAQALARLQDYYDDDD